MSEGGPDLTGHGGHPTEGGQEEILDRETHGLAEGRVALLELLPSQDGNDQLGRGSILVLLKI